MSFWNTAAPTPSAGSKSLVTSANPICSLGSLNAQPFGLSRPGTVLLSGGNRSAVISDAVKSATGPVILINLDWNLTEDIMVAKSTSHSLIRMDWPESRGVLRDSGIATTCVNPLSSGMMPPKGDQRILMLQLLTISLISTREGFWEIRTQNLIAAIFDLLLAEFEQWQIASQSSVSQHGHTGKPVTTPASALNWINGIFNGTVSFDPTKAKMLGCHTFTVQTLDQIIGGPVKMRDAILTSAAHYLHDFSEQALQKMMADFTALPFPSSFEAAGRPVHPLIAVGHSGQGKARSHLTNATATSLIEQMVFNGDPTHHKLVVIDNAEQLPQDEYVKKLVAQGRVHNTTVLFATPDMNLISSTHDPNYASDLEKHAIASVRADLSATQTDHRVLTKHYSKIQSITFEPALSDLSSTVANRPITKPIPQTVMAKLASLLSKNAPHDNVSP